MTRVLRCRWLLGGLMLGLACSTEQPTAPSAVPVPPIITDFENGRLTGNPNSN
jgi:hypothetical protein